MRWGLSWGATFPHVVEIQGLRYELRTQKFGQRRWNAYGTVNGVCVQATGSSERAARCKWAETVRSMHPLLQVPVEQSIEASSAVLLPETCEVLRSIQRRLTTRPRLDG